MKIFVMALIIFLVFISPARAQTGDDLMKNCASAMDVMDKNKVRDVSGAGLCFGYIGGFMALNLAYQSIHEGSHSEITTPLFCLPLTTNNDRDKVRMSAVSVDQATRVVFKFLKDHPERLHEDSTVLTIDALRQAFPCNLNVAPKATTPEEKEKMYKKAAELINSMMEKAPEETAPEESNTTLKKKPPTFEEFIDDYYGLKKKGGR